MKKKAPKKNPATKKAQATRKPAIRLADYEKLPAAKATKPTQPMNVRDIHPKTLMALNLMGQARHDVLMAYVRNIDEKLDLLDSRIRTLNAWEKMQAALEDAKLESPAPPAEKEEPLKVGDWVVVIGPSGVTGTDRFRGKVGRVESYATVHSVSAWHLPEVDAWFDSSNLRKLSPAEVSAHLKAEQKQAEEWSKYDCLQEGDACETTREQVDEIVEAVKSVMDKGKGANAPPDEYPYLAWVVDRLKCAKKTSAYAINWIPFDLFLHRAKGTAAKLAQEAKAKELAMPIAFGTKIEYQGNKGWRIATNQPYRGQWLATKTDTAGLAWLKRSEFTVIPD